ncbi:YcxB family protein [Streptomyces sp. 150FB]|uniref:YcxB family protein n=1 Tax=Streptomyces sp. 150FB TaxID=1576605 RepID=UPI00099D7522|nr:YcxB family protein [Streptomyces sp. 150FB]
MTVDQQSQTGDSLRFVYRPSREDIAEVMRTRRRVTASGRTGRVIVIVGLLFLATVGVLSVVNGEPARIEIPVSIFVVGILALSLVMRRLGMRVLYRAKARGGDYAITVDAHGVRVATAITTMRVPWSDLSGYTETERLFVLLHRRANTINTTPLPKRALPQPTDTDRLRELLDRHSTRVKGTPST